LDKQDMFLIDTEELLWIRIYK